MYLISNILFFFRSVFTLVCLGGRLPVFGANDRQAHLALLVDVRMVDFCLEANLWRFERILSGKVDLDPKGALVVRSVFLQTISVITGGKFRGELCVTAAGDKT